MVGLGWGYGQDVEWMGRGGQCYPGDNEDEGQVSVKKNKAGGNKKNVIVRAQTQGSKRFENCLMSCDVIISCLSWITWRDRRYRSGDYGNDTEYGRNILAVAAGNKNETVNTGG